MDKSKRALRGSFPFQADSRGFLTGHPRSHPSQTGTSFTPTAHEAGLGENGGSARAARRGRAGWLQGAGHPPHRSPKIHREPQLLQARTLRA